MDTATQLDVIDRFLTDLGFRLVREPLRQPSFVPGIYIEGMTMLVDVARLNSPGDIYHEAGHVAIVPSMFRGQVYGDVENSLAVATEHYVHDHEFTIDDDRAEDPVCRGLLQCSENEAIAWSYAAAIGSGLPPEAVFHPKAFDGEAEDIHTMLSLRCHYGIHGLQAGKMTTVRMYPKMLLWLQK